MLSNQTNREDAKLLHLERLLTIKQMQINSLLEISQAINNNFSTVALFRIFEFTLKAQIGVQRIAMFVKNDEWDIAFESGAISKEKLQSIDVDEDLSDLTTVKHISQGFSKRFSDFEYIIPTFHKETPLAYLLIGEMKADNNDTIEEKLKFIQTITNIIVVAIENKKLFKSQIDREVMKKEFEFAAKMQTMLIPDKLPVNEKIEMAAVYMPHQDIGGDIYDIIELSDDELAFCIGDISGKGLAAALLMANFQANLHIMISSISPVEQFVQELNSKLVSITKGDKFITLFIGFYNTKTRKLRYVNAGHNPPLLARANGEITELEEGCTILGMFDELPSITIGCTDIHPNDILISYTDGLIDVENEEHVFFGLERLIDFLKSYKHLPMEEFNTDLYNYVHTYKGKEHFIDDITILSSRFF